MKRVTLWQEIRDHERLLPVDAVFHRLRMRATKLYPYDSMYLSMALSGFVCQTHSTAAGCCKSGRTGVKVSPTIRSSPGEDTRKSTKEFLRRESHMIETIDERSVHQTRGSLHKVLVIRPPDMLLLVGLDMARKMERVCWNSRGKEQQERECHSGRPRFPTDVIAKHPNSVPVSIPLELTTSQRIRRTMERRSTVTVAAIPVRVSL